MNRQRPQSQQAPETTHIWKNLRVDIPILASVLAVLLAVSSASLVRQATNSEFVSIGLYNVALILIVTTLIYSAIEVTRRCFIQPQTAASRRERVISAAVGAGVLSIISLFIASNLLIKLFSLILLLAALVLITQVVAQSLETDEVANDTEATIRNFPRSSQTQQAQQIYQPPIPTPRRQSHQNFAPPERTGRGPSQLDLEPAYLRASSTPSPLYNEPTISQAQVLSPLFENDELHQFPQTGGKIRFFVQTKNNDTLIACEDACVISPNQTRLALCDGTSASNLPRPWATLLGKQWIKDPLTEWDTNTLQQWLEEPRQRWEAWIREVWFPTLNQRNQQQRQAPLSPESIHEIIRGGAAATFLGLYINETQCQWKATAIGDTCLFLLRPTPQSLQLVEAFPLQHSSQFNDSPALLSSRADANLAMVKRALSQRQGTYQPGDIFVMATDALAAWIFAQIEQDISTLIRLLKMARQRDFEAFVDEKRASGVLHDDDTTLVMFYT